jgi:UMF1 family MFS transporter
MVSIATTPGVDLAARRAVAGWVLYDLANVVFAINVVSLSFPLWVVDDAVGDADVGVANGVAMALVFGAAPVLGLLADRTGRRLPYLTAATLACAANTTERTEPPQRGNARVRA